MNAYQNKRYFCPCGCGKDFTTFNESQNHINYCCQSPYQCRICDKGFIDEKPFLTHLIECHRGEILKCFNKVQQPTQPNKSQHPQIPPNYSNQSTAYTNGNFGSAPPKEESFNMFSNQSAQSNSVDSVPRNSYDNPFANGGAAVPSCIADVNYSNIGQNGSIRPSNPGSIGRTYQNTPYDCMSSNSQMRMRKCNEENKEYMFSN